MNVEQLKAAVLALPIEDQWRIKWELDRAVDSLPIVTIAGADILSNMQDDGFKHERLAEWAARAAYRVYSKHSGDDDAHYACVEWGTCLVIEYAKDDGVTLTAEETADA